MCQDQISKRAKRWGQVMKIIYVIIILIIHLFPINAYSSISGTVVDNYGNPVYGAQITFSEESSPLITYSTLTDIEGKYTLDLFPVFVANNPVKFELMQNYPNPFNPSTTIPFILETPNHVTLKIFDILGQQIATVINENLNAGSHTVIWDGKDDWGSYVSTGIYLYQLNAGGFKKTKKNAFA